MLTYDHDIMLKMGDKSIFKYTSMIKNQAESL
ncbi:hypothetical protein SASC598O02_001540, partial [Snodgrassella alvi SCGC AB-598-O02]